MRTPEICYCLPFLLLAACGSNTPAEAPSARVDTRFTTLYSPDSNGVTGSDGTISIVLDDGSSLFMTGDCFLGEVVGGKRDFSYEMINNSLIHISPDYKYLGAYYGGTPEAPSRSARRWKLRLRNTSTGTGPGTVSSAATRSTSS